MEGASVEELAAIQMSAESLQIMDVYHGFCRSKLTDEWGRRHLHGLKRNLYELYPVFDSRQSLLQDFKKWKRGKNVLCMYANDPGKELRELNLWHDSRKEPREKNWAIRDIGLPVWEQRVGQASHEMARQWKKKWVPVMNKRCCSLVHSEFRYYPVYRGNKTETAKARWGPHCALYDCLELYFSYVETSRVDDK